MQLYNSFPIYIDSSLKTRDKDFYQQLQNWKQSYDHIYLSGDEDRIKFPKLIIKSEQDISEINIEKEDILIELKKNNLDFFAEKQDHPFRLEVDGFVEFKELYPIIDQYFAHYAALLEAPYLQKREKKAQGIYRDGLQDKLTELDEKFLYDVLSHFSQKNIKEYLQQKIDEYFPGIASVMNFVELQKGEYNDAAYPIFVFKGRGLYLHFVGEVNPRLFSLLVLYCRSFVELESCSVSYEKSQKVKNLIPIPIVTLGKESQILSYNKKFSELNLPRNELLKLNHHEQLLIFDVNYRVIVRGTKDQVRQILFFPVDNDLGKGHRPKNQELGIISSSLAHELNNPLGGILAAIDVISFDFESGEELELLDEMRQGVERCKNLVNTFLGFSRVDSNIKGPSTMGIPHIFEQSLNLVRFRLVESQVSFIPNFERKGSFKLQGNPYVLSMIFYLIWSEMITSLSHVQLVKNTLGPVSLVFNIYETEKLIKVNFDKEITVSKDFILSKLVKHLTELARVKISFREGYFDLKSL